MQRKTLIALLCGLLAILLCLGTVLVVYKFTQQEDDTQIYQQKLDTGKKYLESGEYDQAIASYKAAIDADPTNDEAYYQLAILYKDLNRMQDMKLILEEGIAKTASARLKNLYDFYFKEFQSGNNQNTEDNGDINIENTDDDKNAEKGKINISYSNSRVIANYTFKDYVINYKNADLNKVNNEYRYTFTGLRGVVYFFNSEEGESIDFAGNIPFDAVRPNYVILDDLYMMFDGVEVGQRVKVSDLVPLGASVTKSQAYDNTLGNYVQFVFNNCVFEITVDENETFGMDSTHRLYSKFGTGAGDIVKKFTNVISIVDATTGRGVANADVAIREGTNTAGTPVFTGRTDSQGNVEFELYAGTYNMEVTCEDYIIETFEFEVYSTGICSVENITISPELQDAAIRIVLEWGDYPTDLDSYYIDDTGRARVSYRNRQYYDGDKLIAELDVDDTTGYGPETITVYDTSRDFSYAICDFHNTGELFSRNDVTVKVYVAGESQPHVFKTPGDSSITDPVWEVFEYSNGRISYTGTSGQGSPTGNK
ncbi:MAG: tetratricopeptide repeat protein [Ruminococcaceae bacterium]|nr:tetratricopeptide repeat protein [Oscillospiraceae bacterium]